MKNKAINKQSDPMIISGGMGVYISWWRMARIVSMMKGLGVVSGTALEVVYPRLLQNGDKGGHVRRAFKELARRCPALSKSLSEIIDKYYIEGGKEKSAPYKTVPALKVNRFDNESSKLNSFWELPKELQILTIAANFSEVWLAKEGHSGKVGINFLRKVERPLLWALYGAMLANVDYVLVGAGNPGEIPEIIKLLSDHKRASLALKVYGATSSSGKFFATIRPAALIGNQAIPLRRPKFLAIVSSFALAKALADNPKTLPYGFIVESYKAGGHNAPPSKMKFDDKRRPVLDYTQNDLPDIKTIAQIGLPFWIAGSCASAEFLNSAQKNGAVGVQFGTTAALSEQSGLKPELRNKALKLLLNNTLKIKNSSVSPTGFPFKVAQVPGTISEESVYLSRKRICDIGLLQVNYITPDGQMGYRCPAEPVESFTAKGGRKQNTVEKGCLCNALLSAAGLAQIRDGYQEPPIITLGDGIQLVKELLSHSNKKNYTIGHALRFIKGRQNTSK